MNIQSLTLDFYRNFSHCHVDFSPSVNVIFGKNAQGKTNLLEAIEILSTATSHRARYDKELIQFQIDHGFISGEVNTGQRSISLEAKLSRNSGKQLFANGVKMKTKTEFSGHLQTIFFSPDDLYLIRDGSMVRRHYLDTAICQLRPKYARALAEYKRLYDHKSKILKTWREKPSLIYALDDFNLSMAQMGAILIQYRAHFIDRLQQLTPPIHRDFSNGTEELSLEYQTVKTVTNPQASQKEIFEALLLHQEEHRQSELDSGLCLSGPHKDDMIIYINNHIVKWFGSQGQTKTAALSVKLATREIFFSSTGEWPVLLLDDVLSELDEGRRQFVLNRIQGGQVIITSCERSHPLVIENSKVFYVENGTVR